MSSPAYAIGQAVYTRTDTADFAEVTIPFSNLEEMVRLCAEPRDHMILEKVVVFSLVDNEPCALTLAFLSASKGQRPNNLETIPES